MQLVAVVLLSVVSADPSPQQLELLKRFRAEFVAITPGEGAFPKSFAMGRAAGGDMSERPVRTVEMARPFSMAKYEVPQNLWEAVTGANPSRWKGPRNSVEMLDYDEAVRFCEQATALMRAGGLIGQDERVRLPSEAEWEYAARAGSKTVYSFGDDPAELGKYAWFTGNAAGNDPPVGAKAPNAWGLYDMHGYLWEWCADAWSPDHSEAPADGSARPAPAGGAKRRVLRSGSWKDRAESLTSTARRAADATLRDDAVGLRCVLSKDAK